MLPLCASSDRFAMHAVARVIVAARRSSAITRGDAHRAASGSARTRAAPSHRRCHREPSVASPALMVTAPPTSAAAVVLPAVRVMAPPAPVLPSPTVSVMSPPLPPVAAPVVIDTSPVAPAVVESPVTSEMLPLSPASSLHWRSRESSCRSTQQCQDPW